MSTMPALYFVSAALAFVGLNFLAFSVAFYRQRRITRKAMIFGLILGCTWVVGSQALIFAAEPAWAIVSVSVATAIFIPGWARSLPRGT